jgi:RHS repeat-associated protein
MTRQLLTAQRCAGLSFVLFALLILSTTPPASAQGYPPNCSPVGSAVCASMYPLEWQYTNRGTCRGFPARSSEAEAAQDIVTDYTRPDQCNLNVTPSGGWLSGGPHSIGFCGGVQDFVSLPFLHRNTGIPIENHRLYDIDWQQPRPACTSYHARSSIAMKTSLVCPPGMTGAIHGTIVVDGETYSSWYCASSAVAPPKNLGEPDAKNCGALTKKPIHIATGNKFKVETDYVAVGAGGLEFKRFYNHGGVPESQSVWFGANWFTHIGKYWRHTYDRSILHVVSGALTTASAYRADGKVLAFNLYNGAFAAQKDVDDRLEKLMDGGWKFTTSADDVELYDAEGRLLSITTRAGLAQTLAYSDGSTPAAIAPRPGLLIGVTDSFGHGLGFRYNAAAQLVAMTDPAGGAFAYAHDPAGNLVSVTYPDTKVRSYVYDEPGNTSGTSQPSALTGIIDENNARFSTYKYDSAGRATFSGLANGADTTTLSYTSGTSTLVTDALGQTRTYQFSTSHGVQRVSSISSVCRDCGLPASRTFDANGNVASRTDFNGNVTSYSYDTARNLETSRIEASGSPRARTFATTWHPNFRIPTSTTEPNRTTTFTHDSRGNVLTRTVTDTSATPNASRTWSFTYDDFGRVLTEDGPRTDVSDVTTYTYYNCTTGARCGQVNTITNAAGHVTTYDAYNAHGQPTQITDANGFVTTVAYDARQRLADRCAGSFLPACSGGELTHIDYWPTGLLRKAVQADGSYTEFSYDDAHRLIAIRDGANNRITYTLDAMGNRTAENTFDPNNVLKRTHARVFNSLNQLWKEVSAAGTANVTTVLGYDNNGNQTTMNAPLGRNSANAYDELDRLKETTDSNSGVTRLAFDANDNLTSVTDPRGLVTTYTYNGFGDLKALASPDTGLMTNTFDTGGNVVSSTDSRNSVATNTYDSLGRVASSAFRIGTTTDQTITYAYDSGTNGRGHLTGASDASHSMAWIYDRQGRLTGKSQMLTANSATQSMGYGYNSMGQRTTLLMPSGRTIQYGYDSNGKVTSVTLLGTPNVNILSNVTYDPFGPITGWTWGNGIATSRAFDADGKLTSIAHTSTVVGNRTFGYDDAFRITGISDSASGSPSWALGYDLLDRLNSATNAGVTIGYTFDASGNRLAQSGTSASSYQVAAGSNRLTSTSGALVRSYSYDAAGNTLSSGATTHTYYHNGRMKTARLGSAGRTTYLYNALGQRIKKSGGAITAALYFMYDEAGHLVGEYKWTNGALVLVQETVWLGDIPVATLRNVGGKVTVFHVHTDQLNTPRKVTTASTVPVMKWKWDPTPFGEGAPVEPSGAFKYNLRFPGQYFDVESNLSYNYFRDFDPALGRYVESDPIGLAAGVNTYGYVGALPVSRVDPLGLQTAGPCPMGQRSRPVPGAVNGYQCVDDPRAANDPPYCPSGSCAVYPREPPKPVETCVQKCERLRKKCHFLAGGYGPSTRISAALVARAATQAVSAGGTIGSTALGAGIGTGPAVFESLTGMTEPGIHKGCDTGAMKCTKECDCKSN